MVTSVFALALLSGLSQQGGTPRPAAPQAERKVCRASETLGSIMPRRVCRTRAEWAALDSAQGRVTERDMQHMRNGARPSLPGDQ